MVCVQFNHALDLWHAIHNEDPNMRMVIYDDEGNEVQLRPAFMEFDVDEMKRKQAERTLGSLASRCSP